jgi:large subunit ribosomal protein L30
LANWLIGELKKEMAKIKITQVKSGIDRSERQKRTLLALGLRKMLATVEVEATPQIRGMVEKVHHLVKVEEMAG